MSDPVADYQCEACGHLAPLRTVRLRSAEKRRAKALVSAVIADPEAAAREIIALRGRVAFISRLTCPECGRLVTGCEDRTQTAEHRGIQRGAPNVRNRAEATVYYALPCKCVISTSQFEALSRRFAPQGLPR